MNLCETATPSPMLTIAKSSPAEQFEKKMMSPDSLSPTRGLKIFNQTRAVLF